MPDFVGEFVFVQFYAEARFCRDHDSAVRLQLEGFFQVAVAERDLFLDEEVGDAGGELEAGGERYGSHGVMRCDDGIVGFGHACDDAAFGDPAGVAEVGLKDAGGAFFEDFAEAPFGEDAFAGSDGKVGAAGDVDEHVDVLCLAGFLDEHGLIGFEFFDEDLCGLRGDGAVEVDADVHRFTSGFSQ